MNYLTNYFKTLSSGNSSHIQSPKQPPKQSESENSSHIQSPKRPRLTLTPENEHELIFQIFLKKDRAPSDFFKFSTNKIVDDIVDTWDENKTTDNNKDEQPDHRFDSNIVPENLNTFLNENPELRATFDSSSNENGLGLQYDKITWNKFVIFKEFKQFPELTETYKNKYFFTKENIVNFFNKETISQFNKLLPNKRKEILNLKIPLIVGLITVHFLYKKGMQNKIQELWNKSTVKENVLDTIEITSFTECIDYYNKPNPCKTIKDLKAPKLCECKYVYHDSIVEFFKGDSDLFKVLTDGSALSKKYLFEGLQKVYEENKQPPQQQPQPTMGGKSRKGQKYSPKKADHDGSKKKTTPPVKTYTRLGTHKIKMKDVEDQGKSKSSSTTTTMRRVVWTLNNRYYIQDKNKKYVNIRKSCVVF